MKILITGGAGFIGSNLVRHLLAESDHEVLNVDKLTYAGNAESLADVAANPRYAFAQIDLCDADAVHKVVDGFQPDAVMHLAAESHVDRSIDSPGDFIQTNVIGTYNLLQASLAHYRASGETRAASGEAGRRTPDSEHRSFRFLHVSTDEVYGSLAADDAAFTETTPYTPHSPYSASKASSDHLARAWHDTFGLPVIVTNCSNNYGPYQFPEKLIPVVILKCLRGEPIPVYGKGENVRDWLYVEDHCRALRAVVERGTPGETYNIGGNNELRNIDLVHMLCEIMDELRPMDSSSSPPAPALRTEGVRGRGSSQSPLSPAAQRIAGERDRVRGPENTAPSASSRTPATRNPQPLAQPASHSSLISFVTDRPGHDLRYAIDASKIQRELGWTPQEDFQSGFRKTIQWYLENETWWQSILDGSYKLERQGRGGVVS